jgi:hypothetical protein
LNFYRRYEQVRKSTERYSLPDFYYAFVLFSIDEEPKLVKEAMDSTKSKLWKASMVEEMESSTTMRHGI